MTRRREEPLVSVQSSRRYDVCCIGTALVDHLSFGDHDLIQALGLDHGSMTLIDAGRVGSILETIGEHRAISGGSVTNTAAGVASLGGQSVYVGAIAEDALGERYANDLALAGVSAALERHPIDDGFSGTGACFVIVTPDHQRTMATSLGLSGRLTEDAIDPELIGSSSLVYFDGYLLDFPHAQAIVARIRETSAQSQTVIALGLSDVFVVERHFASLSALVEQVDLVFANEDEAAALTGERDPEAAAALLSKKAGAAIVTCAERGASIGSNGRVTAIDAYPVEEVIDTTGAGDLFAAGVCYGVAKGLGAAHSGALGALCAAEVIGHLGARPEVSLADLARRAGLI